MSEQANETPDAVEAAHTAVFGEESATQTPTTDAPTPATTPEQSATEQTPQPETTPATDQPDETQPTPSAETDRTAEPQGPETEPGPTEEPAPGTPEQADLERLQAYRKTTEGRLAAFEAKTKALESELAALRQPATPPQKEEPKPVELPETLQADAAEFDKLYPDFSPLLRKPGPEGDRLRRVLDTLGPEAASLAADNMVLREQVQHGFKTSESQTVQYAQREHLERIIAVNPEVEGLLSSDPKKQEQTQAYFNGVKSWVDTLPYADAAAKIRILQSGSASQINAVLAAYKSQATPPKPKLDDATRRRAALAGGVDNRRGTKPSREKSPADRVATAHHEVFGS